MTFETSKVHAPYLNSTTMEPDKSNKSPHSSNSGRVWAGIIIIVIGALLLLNQLNVFIYFPDWLFSWPMILIIIGLIIGGKSNFQKPSSFILLGLGVFFLLSTNTHFSIGRLFWPIIIIVVGSRLLFGRSNKFGFQKKSSAGYDWDKRVNDENPVSTDDAEYIDSVSVFGNIKKNIVSKNFRGGEIVNIMGGADINLMHADIQGPVVLEVTQIFGGTKIIIPAHWKVQPEMAAVFGGVEDQRFGYNPIPDDNRILYIKGTSIFGGITIKSL